MKDLPNAFWASIFVLMACGLAALALLAGKDKEATMAVITLASSIGTGAFGYIQGHKDGANSVNPQPPADPAK